MFPPWPYNSHVQVNIVLRFTDFLCQLNMCELKITHAAYILYICTHTTHASKCVLLLHIVRHPALHFFSARYTVCVCVCLCVFIGESGLHNGANYRSETTVLGTFTCSCLVRARSERYNKPFTSRFGILSLTFVLEWLRRAYS